LLSDLALRLVVFPVPFSNSPGNFSLSTGITSLPPRFGCCAFSYRSLVLPWSSIWST
jgi:hypothetical protein